MTADVVVLGAGPSGCTSALRLLALGHRVAVIERCSFPRSRVGEALSSGVAELLRFLNLGHILDNTPRLTNVPTRIVWERPEPELVESPQHAAGVIVDRAAFDGQLLAEVAARGGRIFQPCDVRRIDGEPGRWILQLSAGAVTARLILDARGRGGHARTRVPTAPATIALWTTITGSVILPETRLEALTVGWLWGTVLPGGEHRVMAFVDPASLKGRRANELFDELLAASRLFFAARGHFASDVRCCSATPYLDQGAWVSGVVKVGDAALALDPLSSSGVEKSMRQAVQASIAANTLLRDPGAAALVRDFYESSLVWAAATHAEWARSSYARAWPAQQFAFWQARTCPWIGHSDSRVVSRLWEACRAERERSEFQEPSLHAEALTSGIRLSSAARFEQTACAVGDHVELRPAVTHPALVRPLVFLAGLEVVPLLREVHLAPSLGQLIAMWSMRLTPDSAARVAGWLLRRGVLETSCS